MASLKSLTDELVQRIESKGYRLINQEALEAKQYPFGITKGVASILLEDESIALLMMQIGAMNSIKAMKEIEQTGTTLIPRLMSSDEKSGIALSKKIWLGDELDRNPEYSTSTKKTISEWQRALTIGRKLRDRLSEIMRHEAVKRSPSSFDASSPFFTKGGF